MTSSPYRARPLRGTDLTEMQRGNLRVLLRQLHRELGSWVRVAHAVGARREVVKGFFDGAEPGHCALARGVASAAKLDLDVALSGRFVIGDKGIRPTSGGAR